MATINVKTITEISVDMTLNALEHKQLVFFLKHALTPEQAPTMQQAPAGQAVEDEPYTGIVGRLARALTEKGPR